MRKTLQHSLNPLHIYCRLRNLGFPKSVAISIARFYERAIFTFFSGTLYRYSRELRAWVMSSWPVFEYFQEHEFDECHSTSTPKNEPWDGRKPPKVIVRKGSVRWHFWNFSDVRASFHSVMLMYVRSKEFAPKRKQRHHGKPNLSGRGGVRCSGLSLESGYA